MKKISLIISTLMVTGALAVADVNPNRILTCTNTHGSVSIPACGGTAGCIATVTLNGVAINYSVKRNKNDDGGYTYSPKPRAKPKCTIVLKKGNRSLKSVSCGTQLKGASCIIQ